MYCCLLCGTGHKGIPSSGCAPESDRSLAKSMSVHLTVLLYNVALEKCVSAFCMNVLSPFKNGIVVCMKSALCTSSGALCRCSYWK